MKYLAILLTAVALLAPTDVMADPLVDHLQDISVTVRAGDSHGSGTLFTRKVGDDNVTYVWTCGHVVDGLRKVTIDISDGVLHPKRVVTFDDPQIIQEYYHEGRKVGETVLDCRVVRYSDADAGEDLALLEVRRRNFSPVALSANFYTGDVKKIPTPGTELYHVGSLLGPPGSNSVTTGIVSKVGRLINLGPATVLFDQTSAIAYPGSSGGGVYLKSNGQYVGMIVRAAGPGFNFIVPVRRLRDWAKQANVEWAIDSSLPVPEVDQLGVSDIDVTVSPTQFGKVRSPNERRIQKLPFLLR